MVECVDSRVEPAARCTAPPEEPAEFPLSVQFNSVTREPDPETLIAPPLPDAAHAEISHAMRLTVAPPLMKNAAPSPVTEALVKRMPVNVAVVALLRVKSRCPAIAENFTSPDPVVVMLTDRSEADVSDEYSPGLITIVPPGAMRFIAASKEASGAIDVVPLLASLPVVETYSVLPANTLKGEELADPVTQPEAVAIAC